MNELNNDQCVHYHSPSRTHHSRARSHTPQATVVDLCLCPTLCVCDDTCRGLGFMLLRMRVTKAMVWSVMLQTVSAMFAVGIVLLKTVLIGQEEEIISQALIV